MLCVRHPDTETNIRCSRCESPICPQCMVHAPVGIRCPQCAQLKKLPTFELTTPFLGRAIVAGIILAIAGSLIFGFLWRLLIRVPYLELIAIVGLGYFIGEGISVAVNRKRGRTLKLVATASLLLAYILIAVFSVATLSIFTLVAALIGLFVATSRF